MFVAGALCTHVLTKIRDARVMCGLLAGTLNTVIFAGASDAGAAAHRGPRRDVGGQR